MSKLLADVEGVTVEITAADAMTRTAWVEYPNGTERHVNISDIHNVRTDHGDFIEWHGEPKLEKHVPNIIEGLTAPIAGYIQDNRVHFTTEEPPTYTAKWTDEPGITRFVKKENAAKASSNDGGSAGSDEKTRSNQIDYTTH